MKLVYQLFKKKMYYLEKQILVPTKLEDCWEFFSSPKNLAVITPDYMNFKITSPNNIDKMREGQIISYTVQPLFGIPMEWVTEITKVKDKEFFIDEQRVGPYKLWHHEHYFEETEKGVLMTDQLFYCIPFGPLGKFAHSLFIKKQLEGIFNYREKKITEIFGKV